MGSLLVIGVKIETNALDVARSFDKRYRKNKRFATAVALTKTAKRLKDALSGQMKQVFDRPKPFVTKGVFLRPAKKNNLTATVGVKDVQGLNILIAHQFVSGSRKRKGIEIFLNRNGYTRSDEFVAPGVGAKLDRYGNISRAQLKQVVLHLRGGQQAGSVKNNRGIMFWSNGDGLPRGVWLRKARSNPRPILLVINKPTYRRLINLPKLANKVVARHFDREFGQAFRGALRTSR